jgi:hypothetical protein
VRLHGAADGGDLVVVEAHGCGRTSLDRP